MQERPVSDNPLYNANKMKIGIIAMNCSHGSTITTAENAWEMNWPDTKEVAVMADRAGLKRPVVEIGRTAITLPAPDGYPVLKTAKRYLRAHRHRAEPRGNQSVLLSSNLHE